MTSKVFKIAEIGKFGSTWSALTLRHAKLIIKFKNNQIKNKHKIRAQIIKKKPH